MDQVMVKSGWLIVSFFFVSLFLLHIIYAEGPVVESVGSVNEAADGTGTHGAIPESEIEGADNSLSLALALICKDRDIYGNRLEWKNGDDILYPIVWGNLFQGTYGTAQQSLPGPFLEDWDQSISLTLDWATNPLLWRFEGRCYVYAQSRHTYYTTDAEGTPQKIVFPEGEPQWEIQTGNGYTPEQQQVYWDSGDAACEQQGGDRLTNEKIQSLVSSPSSTVPINDYTGYRCCGDDHIWLYNKEVDYNRPGWGTGQDAAEGRDCLYFDIDLNGRVTDGTEDTPNEKGELIGYITATNGEDVRACKPVGNPLFGDYRHKNYDPPLDLWNDDLMPTPHILNPFYFKKDEFDSKTDVGIWSDRFGRNPLFCDYEFIPSVGRKYTWMNFSTAGEKHYENCELLLGANWTGHHCCGNEYTNNDPNTILGESYNDPLQSGEDYFALQESIQGRDFGYMGACVQGRMVEKDKTALFSEYSVQQQSEVSPSEEELHLPSETISNCVKRGDEQNDPRLYGILYVNTDTSDPPQFQDRCIDATQLEEYACTNNRAKKQIYACAYGCADGFCQSPLAQSVRNITHLLNYNGSLYSCAQDDLTIFGNDFNTGQPLITPDQNKPMCSRMSTENNQPGYVCGYQNRAWADLNAETLKQYFNYREDTPLQLVDAGALTGDQANKECCFNSGCWNGTSCVSSIDDAEATWGGSTATITSTGNEQTFMCLNTTWYGPLEPKYNWFENRDLKGFCPQSFSCYCEKDACGDAVQQMGMYDCTKEPNLFVGDHYCESSYGSAGEIIGSNWTTRTKFLAFNLMHLAASDGAEEYALYCDYYQRSLNSYDVIVDDVPKDAIALFTGANYPLQEEPAYCSITYNDKTVLAFPLKSDLQETGASEQIVSFVNDVLLEDANNEGIRDALIRLNSCEEGVGYTSALPHGEFVKCEAANNFVVYNNKLKALIFSRDGLPTLGGVSIPPLTIDAVNTFNSLFNTESQRFVGFIHNNPESLNATQPNSATRLWWSATLDGFNVTRDFNRFYINKKGDALSVFGFVETKHSFIANNNNNEYLGVYIDPRIASDVTCGNITRIFTRSFCKPYQDKLFVIGKYEAGVLDAMSEIYWKDLTAKLRIS